MLRNTDKGWFGFCAIPLSYSVLLFFTSKYNLNTVLTERAIVFAGLVFILTLAAYVLILRFFQQTREQLTLQNEQDLLKTQVTAAQVHLEALQDSQEKTIIYRHDMRHHLNLCCGYLHL
jgi:ABC-type nickel/cobalt efflux system permease component RcnA